MYDKIYPVIILRGVTVYPSTVLSFDVGRDKSVAAIKKALEGDRMVFLTSQKDITVDDPSPDDVYRVGCLAMIKQVVKLSGNSLRATVEGVDRACMTEVFHINPYYSASVDVLYPTSPAVRKVEVEAVVRTAQDAFDVYSGLIDRVPPEISLNVISADEPGFLSDYIANNCIFKPTDKQAVLETLDVMERLKLVIQMLYHENEILMLEAEIADRVHDNMDQNQREYYIREQIKELTGQLGVVDEPFEEAEEYAEKIEALNIPQESREKLLKEVDKFAKMPIGSHDAAAVRTYLDTVVSLPWGVYTKDRFDVAKTKKILDRDHYGLEKIKERILEFVAVRKLAPDIKGQIICLVGPPGTGKSSIAASIAKAVNRSFVRISLGGIRDEAEIRGHRKTYIAAMPGRIIDAVSRAKCSNPLILLDEVDKLASDFHGDPSSALLEVLDPEQNNAFRDNYLEVPYDLSKTIFIATANNPDTIPAPLRDRMEIIELTSYTAEEKFHIAKDHLIAKEIANHGLSARNIRFKDDAIDLLISGYTREAGVRELKRTIASLCRKAAKSVASGNVKSVTFTSKNIQEYIGPVKYLDDDLAKGDNVGIVNGLAWTAVGGEMLQVEVNVMPGDGKLELTGSLGDVMKESAHAAISYIRANFDKLGIETDFHKKYDIHVHVPDGATPKDGPSAGITITTAIISALCQRKVRGNIAMTGEITIRGRVLPIGGLKEKSMAAYKHGIDTIIIPEGNYRDLHDISAAVKSAVKFIPVTDYTEVVDLAFLQTEKSGEDNIGDEIGVVLENRINTRVYAGR